MSGRRGTRGTFEVGEGRHDALVLAGGDAFMSNLILAENPSLTETQVQTYYLDYLNLDLTIYNGFPTSFDSTRHIDMWMLPVDDDEIIIGEYALGTGQPYTITEGAVADLNARGYTVHRTPGWNTSGTHYTYTNSVIVNDLVFIPLFGGSYTSQDAQALAVYQAAFPNHQIIQVDSSTIIHAAGALHCIVMHVPAYTDTMRVTPGGGLDASGPVGGPFVPASVAYTVLNTSDAAIDYAVTWSAPWLGVTNPGGVIPAQSSASVTVRVGAAADLLPSGAYGDDVVFTNLTDHSGDSARSVRLVVGEPEAAYSFPLDSDPGWAVEGLWSFGQPTGGGGAHGGPDPTAGHTGANVYGYNLAGDYENNLPERHLTSASLDCNGLHAVRLRFRRWLGVEQPQYDHAAVRVSADGMTWTTVWQNTAEVADTSWVDVDLDISAVADNQPTVYLRWTMGATDSDWTYCGWNIDDVEIWGVIEGSQPPLFADGFETGDSSGWLVVVGLLAP